MATFSDRLKSLREEHGLSQIQLAKALGMSNGAIGNYESGQRKPRYEDLENIADYFNVELDYLLGRINSKPEFNCEERWLINCYRNSPAEVQIGIKTILRAYDEQR